MTTNQIAACFNTFVQDLTLDSSPAAVSIWNHHHKHNTNAIAHSIHNIRFIVVFSTVMSFGSFHVHGVSSFHIHGTSIHQSPQAQNP